MSYDLENWMGDLSEHKQTLPFVNIAIPGSHDSMTCTISRDSPLSPDSEEVVQRLMKYCGFAVRPTIYKWCVTQTSSVQEQLKLGIRYFDLRVASKTGTSDLYFVHGMYGARIGGPLNEINTFLREHPTEVVILDLQHFYEFNTTDHTNCIELIKNIFKDLICPRSNIVNTVSLDWLKENGYQVIVIYRSRQAIGEPLMWLSGSWPTPWPETMSKNDLIKFLTGKLENRPKNCGFVSQCVLTPTNWTVIRAPYSNVMKKCAVPASKVILPWIDKQNIGLLNVVIADFIHLNNASFPKTVITRNFSEE